MSEVKDALIESLRSELKSKLDVEVGTVIRFETHFYENGLTEKYNLVAIFTREYLWHITGKNNRYGNRLSTDVFLKTLRDEAVKNIQVATDWVEL